MENREQLLQQPSEKAPKKSMKELEANYLVSRSIIFDGVYPKIGCEKCDNGFIKNTEKGKFPYSSTLCECYKKVEYYKRVFALLQNANINRAMFKRYDISKFQQDVITLEELYALLDKNEQWLYLQ